MEIVDGQPRAEALFGEVKYAYYADASCQEEIAKPTAPGTYYVKAYVEGNDNYAGAESAPLRFSLLENGSGEVDPPLPPEEEEPTQEGIGNGWILALSISLPALALLAALLVCFFRRRKK